jgi:predicted O-methyltransferase YrrM
MVHELLDSFTREGIRVQVGDSETRTQDPDAQFAKAFLADGTRLSSGAGIALGEVQLLELLLEGAGGQCLVIGNGFGWSAVALGLMLRGRGRVVAMDACLEGLDGGRGLDLVRAIAARHGLPLKAVEGLSPRDLPGIVGGHFGGRLDIVLVDSLHTDEQQLQDYEGIRPYLAPGALVVFHDVLNWRMEASFQEIARRDGRGAAILHRTASGLGLLFPPDAPYVPLLEAFRGEALPPRPAGNVWEDRYSYLACLYADSDDPAVGKKYLALALGETPRPELVWMDLARHHFDRQNWEDCLACLGEARSLRPDWSEPTHFEALVARSRGASPEVVWSLLAAALDQAEPTPELKLDAGFAAFDLDRLDLAERLGREAVAERPDWSLPRHLGALVARRRGAPAQELWLLLSEALRLRPVSPELKHDAALAALETGRLDQAATLAAEAAEMAPDWEPARKLLARVKRLGAGAE